MNYHQDIKQSLLGKFKIDRSLAIEVLFGLVLACYGLIIAANLGACSGGSDSSGYLNNARLILSGNIHQDQRTVEQIAYPEVAQNIYVPLGFIPSNDNQMVPTYAFGLPILISLFSLVTSLENAANIVIWLHSIGSLILVYQLALLLKIERKWALFAVFILAACPLFIAYSLQLMSDMPSLFWNSAAIFAALKSRQKTNWAIFAGVATSIAIMIRPTNALIILPTLVALGKNPKSWIYYILSGIPGAILLGAINYNLYGKIIATGYGDVTQLFRLKNAPLTLEAYANYIPSELTPLTFLLLGVLIPEFWRRHFRAFLLNTLWILIFFIFYTFYQFTYETWWYMRFLLPAFPAIIFVIVLVLQELFLKLKNIEKALLSVLLCCGVLIWFFCVNSVLKPLQSGKFGQSCIHVEAANWSKNNLPNDSIIFSLQLSGVFLHYTNFPIVRYDLARNDDLDKIKKAAIVKKRPIYFVIEPYEIDLLKISNSKKWQEIKKIGNITIWKQNY